ncbi:5-(carboxyamino)imidazole ribonucleotide synthase [Granulicella cerasi]|uniref:N5-carboxyaminoimidazole ribonucleotide synthase n=1 Tax=Granulicella cerasi TaxID=741063 RepID=A0ABW1Z5W3_9BACT|nr:5-(carboxyamino)imidazole ribonucleotide synthase [Granulicella cerasi]
MSNASKPRVGILGAGQLALMLAEAGERIGVDVICAGSTGDCAEQVAPLIVVDLEHVDEVQTFADTVDVLTLESENIEAPVLANLTNLAPNAGAVKIAQDRLFEKDFLRFNGVATAPYAEINSLRDLTEALKVIGAPSILKTRRLGYDGRGQVRISHVDEAASAWAHTGGAPCILEGMVDFECEVSLIAARSANGELAFYPLVRNEHRAGILRVSTAPYENKKMQKLAEKHLKSLLQALDYVGVLTVEFFVTYDSLIANEMAPRVHNSGHWTIEGSETSQFENHLRAVLGWPLGSTASKPTVMLNCIGSMPTLEETKAFPALHRHDYGKAAREGRKVGHLTIAAEETATIEEWKKRLAD